LTPAGCFNDKSVEEINRLNAEMIKILGFALIKLKPQKTGSDIVKGVLASGLVTLAITKLPYLSSTL